MQTLARGTDAEKLAAKLFEAGPEGRELRQLALDLGLTSDPPVTDEVISCGPSLALHRAVFDALQTQALAAVRGYHVAHPTRRGMPLEDLRRSLPKTLKPPAFHIY